MAWPTDDLDTTHLDAGGDSPADARPMLKRLIDYVKLIIAARGATDGICELNEDGKVPPTRLAKGVAGGVAPLDSGGKVPSEHLPGATTTESGAVQRASNADVQNGQGAGVVSAGQLSQRTATTTRTGMVRLANSSSPASTSTTRVVTPAFLKAYLQQ